MTNFQQKFLGITDNEFAFIETICKEYGVTEGIWEFIRTYGIDEDDAHKLVFAVVDKVFEKAIGSGFDDWDFDIEAIYGNYQAYRDSGNLYGFFTDFEPVEEYYTDGEICEVFEDVIATYNSIFKGIPRSEETTNSITYERSTRRR